MRGLLIAMMFVGIAIAFWDDVGVRRLNIALANIWCAASYARRST